jgi:hypothetical protein
LALGAVHERRGVAQWEAELELAIVADASAVIGIGAIVASTVARPVFGLSYFDKTREVFSIYVDVFF